MCTLALPAVASLVSCALLLQGLQAKVVEEFSHDDSCKDSLYMGTPPRGFISGALRKICQRYGNKPYYVTLYDPRKHIPVYSGYTFKKSDGETKVDVPWMFEPQVSLHKLQLPFAPWQKRILMANPMRKQCYVTLILCSDLDSWPQKKAAAIWSLS